MTTGARLVLLGRQGAGKGTQCARLAAHFGIPHISTGDMLRAAVKEGTEFGKKANEFMAAGDLVPDDVMIGVVDDRLHKPDARDHGYVLDGFPRTVGQAEALARITDGSLEMVIDLDVPTEVVLPRLAGRRVCKNCGWNYSVEEPPSSNWTCDNCGGEVVQREDDKEEAIQRRLDLYEQETTPLTAWYAERGLLVVVDGNSDPDEVTERLLAAIDAVRS